MRTAPDTPENGQTVRTTTVRTVLPADPLTVERKTPDFWEYFEKLPPNWGSPPDRHLLYIYRRISEAGPCPPLERCAGYMAMPDRSQLVLNNREELEFAIAAKYGGGTYRLILKNGSERVSEGRITAEGPQKNTPPGILDTAPTVTAVTAETASSDVAKTAMNIVSSHESEAINVGLGMMRTAADVVQRVGSQGNQPASTSDDITRMFMQAMIQKMLAPQTDPLELVTKILTIAREVSGGAGVGTGDVAPSSIVNKILETGLERVLNPAPSGPVSSAAAELVRQLPQIGSYAVEGIREWRIGSEAQLHTAQIMATRSPQALPPGAPAPGNGMPGNGTVQPPQRPITQATQIAPPPAAAPQVMPGEPSPEFIESKIVEILRRPLSADDAADEVLSFLDLMAPILVEQLSACSEAQLVQLFQTRPVLRQYHDLARLQEFIKSFLKYSKETEEPPAPSTTVKPN